MDGIEKLYEEYYSELVKWCRSMTQDPVMAEDLVQEAFLRALINADILQELHPGQRRAWLYRTIKNLYVDRVRHASFETTADTMPEQPQDAEGFSEVDVELLLNSLPGEEGLLFAMRYLQGYNAAEIGDFLGMPPGTVRSKLSLARKHLRDALRERKWC